jgi:hypothetical protein
MSLITNISNVENYSFPNPKILKKIKTEGVDSEF